MKQKHFQMSLLIVGILMILGQPAAADLAQYWPFDDGGSSATAANLAAGGNVGQLSAGGVPESWVTADLHGPLTSRGTDPSTAALRLTAVGPDAENPLFEIMNGGNLGLNATGVGLNSEVTGGQVTMSMWINPSTLSGDDRLFGHAGPIDFPVGPASTMQILSDGAVNIWPNDLQGWQPIVPSGSISTGAWHHLALVWNNGDFTAYHNGAETGKAIANFMYDSANSGAREDSTQDFGLANRFNIDIGTFGSSYDGLVDDLAIWDTGLQPANITLLAGGTSPRDIDDSNPIDGPPPIQPPRVGKLVQYWPLDDTVGTTATSGVSPGNQGTLIDFDNSKLNDAAQSPPGDWIQNDIPAQLGHSTGALDFEGNDVVITGVDGNYVNGGDIGVTSDRLTPGSAAAVSLWFKPRTLDDGDPEFGADYRIFNQAGDEVDQGSHLVSPGGAVRVTEDGTVQVFSGQLWRPVTGAGAVVADEWHHLAFVWDKHLVTGYVNGVQQLTDVANFNFDTSADPNQEFGLGRITNNSFGITPDGIFDDVSIWDGFLTASEIMQLANGISPLDLTPGVGPNPDLNGDGFVDGLDLGILLGAWDPAVAAAMGITRGSVPEPTSAILLLTSLTGLLVARRR